MTLRRPKWKMYDKDKDQIRNRPPLSVNLEQYKRLEKDNIKRFAYDVYNWAFGIVFGRDKKGEKKLTIYDEDLSRRRTSKENYIYMHTYPSFNEAVIDLNYIESCSDNMDDIKTSILFNIVGATQSALFLNVIDKGPLVIACFQNPYLSKVMYIIINNYTIKFIMDRYEKIERKFNFKINDDLMGARVEFPSNDTLPDPWL